MRKQRVKALRESLRAMIPEFSKQQWRTYKRNFQKGLLD